MLTSALSIATKTFKKRIESHLSKEIERMVNNKCSVPYCPVAQAGLEKRGKTRGNVTHFSFPKNPDLHAQWLAALNRENFTPTTSSRVCEIHFNREDFIPPKDPNKLHVVKRLKEHTIPTRHLGDGAGLEVLTQESLVMAGDMETVVTDGTVHYESIEQGIALRPSEIEQTIELEDGNVETIIVKVENDKMETDDTESSETTQIIKVAHPHPLTKKEKQGDPLTVPQDVLENTMQVENGYFERFLVKQPPPTVVDRPPIPGNDLEPEVVIPHTNDEGELLSSEEKVDKLVLDLKKAYKKNQTLAKANKSLRLQLHQAQKKTLSQKVKHEVVREIMSPFFTQTQIDCFCRPSWLRSRNWGDQDFELALTLRRLMSKKAFSYLRKKRVVPMPSLTSLRKYQREHGIVIHHNPNKTGSNLKGTSKKKQPKKLPLPLHLQQAGGKSYSSSSKVMQAINIPSSAMISNTYDGQQIQIVNTNGTTIGTVQGVLAPSNQLQTIQLQVVDPPPSAPQQSKVQRVKAVTGDENWKFIQVTPDGQTTTYIQQSK